LCTRHSNFLYIQNLASPPVDRSSEAASSSPSGQAVDKNRNPPARLETPTGLKGVQGCCPLRPIFGPGRVPLERRPNRPRSLCFLTNKRRGPLPLLQGKCRRSGRSASRPVPFRRGSAREPEVVASCVLAQNFRFKSAKLSRTLQMTRSVDANSCISAQPTPRPSRSMQLCRRQSRSAPLLSHETSAGSEWHARAISTAAADRVDALAFLRCNYGSCPAAPTHRLDRRGTLICTHLHVFGGLSSFASRNSLFNSP
jgi:hypothetical protein